MKKPKTREVDIIGIIRYIYIKPKICFSYPKEEWVAMRNALRTGLESSLGVNHHEATEPDTVQPIMFLITVLPQARHTSHSTIRGRPRPLYSHLKNRRG